MKKLFNQLTIKFMKKNKKLNQTCLVITLGLLLFSCTTVNAKNSIAYAPSTTNGYKVEIIKGSIKDMNGQPVIGANVAIKNGKDSVNTDMDGNFTINAQTGQTLVVTYVGFKSQEVVITSKNMTIVLQEDTNTLDEVIVGSRFSKARTDTDRPVPVDIISIKELQSTGQADLGQSLTFSAPSFNAVKFGINDSAPFVDPATLRGLGPDQVLVLVNNKRRHKVSFLSINDGVGKGQAGTDINAIPALSLKRVEVLRDGAAAQYGSDAIAGVINLELNDSDHGGTVNVYTGIGNTKPNLDVKGVVLPDKTYDGLTYNLSANAGFKIAQKGFINTTLSYSHTDGYDRSGTYASSNGFYVKDPVQDAALIKANNIDLDRAILGAPRNTSYGIFVNSGLPISDHFKAYIFGGYSTKEVVTGVFTRAPSNKKRSVLSIFPNGYNPIAPATLQDYNITGGLKGTLGTDWNADFSISQGGNRVDWYAENTVNPSLGAASPTEFKVGVTRITQTLLNADIAKSFHKDSYPNLSFAAGTEFRSEVFEQIAGDPASYAAGPDKATKDIGSSGREGFSNETAGKWNRTNVGLYTEIESDLTKSVLLGAAIRVENYSDFGTDFTYKVNSRVKIVEPIAIRGSFSRGFRAPSITQSHYSNYANISFDNAGNSIVNPIISTTSFLASKLGINGLEKETSIDISYGVTSKIGKNFTLTADIYTIDVDNRILLSGGIDVSGIQEFADAGFPDTANVFVNAIDTRTQGFEFVAGYKANINADNKVTVNVAFSSNNTSIRNKRKTSTGIEVVDDIAALFITAGQPRNKLISSLNYNYKTFGFMFRASTFGKVSDPTATLAVVPSDPNALQYQVFSSKTLFDISFTTKLLKDLSLTAGVNNLTDVYPDLLQKSQTTNEVVFSRRTNQFGTQGRFMNLSLNYTF
jgi:iron complex outermembrane receptor protein